MKKYFLTLLILTALLMTTIQFANAITVGDGISKYKRKDYVGCTQDMKEIIKRDPANAMAYYYLGLANVQLGMKDEARKAYEKVETLSNNAKLKEYAQLGLGCIDDPTKCKTPETEEDKFLKSGKFASPQATKTLKQMEVDREIKQINRTVEQYKSDANTSTDNIATTSTNKQPTKEEISQALDTLARAGINPYMNNQMQTNNELMQLNMMLGNNQNNNQYNNNSYFNMLPYIQSQQAQGQKIKPEVMQAMMMQSMMGNMNNYGY